MAVIKAADQTTILDLTDAYSVFLTSETFTFVGGTAGVASGATCETQVVVYCGNKLCSSVSVTQANVVCPTGISATVTGSGTSTVTIKFTTTATVANACEATIPVVVDGMTINKKFSFAVAKQGTAGTNGTNGTNGTTTYTWVKYADNESGSGMSDSPTGKRYIGMAFNKTTATESTTPGDYSWSPLYDNVSVGGTNLVLKSALDITSASYNIKNLDLADANLIEGEQVTISIKGQLGSDRTYWGIYNSGGSVSMTSLYPADRNSKGVYTKTFTWRIGTSSNTYVSIYHMPNTSTTASAIEWVKLERGNIATDWTPAIDDKADTSDLDALAGIVSSISSDMNFKAGMSDFEAMQAAFDQRVAQDIKDKAQLATDLSTMAGRMALVETIAGNNKLVTEFIDTVITQSNEGIYIAKGNRSTGILISDNRISFMDNNVEVAYISNQTMQINHGIFVESATISDFKFEKIPGTTILSITWTGV